jgi:GTP cyclohydrolase I
VADNDLELGLRINQILKDGDIETPMSRTPYDRSERTSNDVLNTMISSHSAVMDALNLDMADDSLKGTPRRVAKMYKDELFFGLDYRNFPACSTFDNKAQYDELLMVKTTVQSFCEHHFLPFIGNCWVGYLPGEKVLGLSKFNRVVEFFSRRPQVQERLTMQIFTAFKEILQTENVAVIIEAEHYCVKLRGVQDQCGETISSKMGGKFFGVPDLRAEFLRLTGH